MDSKKYYTPSIEEFHVGFECEIIKSSKFKKTIVDNHELETVLYEVGYGEQLSDNYRVKYLDKEDIESLGWIVEQKPLGSFFEGEYYVRNEGDTTTFEFENINEEEPTIDINGNYFKIKNKSEFKKLMNQWN